MGVDFDRHIKDSFKERADKLDDFAKAFTSELERDDPLVGLGKLRNPKKDAPRRGN